MGRGTVRASVWGPIVGVLLLLIAVVALLESRRAQEGAAPADSVTAPAAGSSQPQSRPAPPPALVMTPPQREPAAAPEPVPYIENLVWGDIDLREAQAIMPDNLYWKWGAPTDDPELLAEREAEKKRRNEEYGRVLSGDAGEEEVDAYYDYRERLSTDYLEFAEWMRNRYGDGLSEEFRGLLDLSIKLHSARLAQMSQDRDRALAHSRERARIRAEWQREQKEFEEALRE